MKNNNGNEKLTFSEIKVGELFQSWFLCGTYRKLSETSAARVSKNGVQSKNPRDISDRVRSGSEVFRA